MSRQPDREPPSPSGRLNSGGATDLENVDGLLKQAGHGVFRAGRTARKIGQRGGFGAGPGGLLGTPGREVHDGCDGGGHPDKDQEGEHILRIADGQVAHRRGGEVVHQQAAPERRNDRGPQATDERHGDRPRELDQRGRGQVLVRIHGEHQLEQRRQENRENEADPDPGPAQVPFQVPLPGNARAAAAGGLRDREDVDVAGAAGHAAGNAPAANGLRQSGEPALAGEPDDDLAGVDAAGEVEQGAGRISAGHDVVAAAKVLDQPALGFEGLRRLAGHPVGRPHVHRQQVAAVDPVEDPGAAADQGLAVGAAGQPDDDALAGGPAGLDPVALPVPGQAFVHPVRQPQQGQLTQCGQIARTEVIREGGIDPVSRVRSCRPRAAGAGARGRCPPAGSARPGGQCHQEWSRRGGSG